MGGFVTYSAREAVANINFPNKEEFVEVQRQLMENNKIKDQTEGKIQLHERAKRRDELTLKELATLNEAKNPTYASVGKMFMLSPLADVKKDVTARLERIDTELEKLKKQRVITEQRVKESEKALQELMVKNFSKDKR